MQQMIMENKSWYLQISMVAQTFNLLQTTSHLVILIDEIASRKVKNWVGWLGTLELPWFGEVCSAKFWCHDWEQVMVMHIGSLYKLEYNFTQFNDY